jgi:hypothetical protein
MAKKEPEYVPITIYVSRSLLAKLDAAVEREADRTGANTSRTAVACRAMSAGLSGEVLT